MNSLSWLLYAANVCQNLGIVFSVVCVSGLIGWAITRVIIGLSTECMPPLRADILGALFGMSIVASLIPSERTIYMIAASELGQRVVQSDDAREMIDLLRNKVREALKPPTKG